MKTLFALFGSLALFGSASLRAQEAWLLEMPKKFGSYLLSKSKAGENDTLQEIIAKLPALVTKKTVREVESIKWKAPGKNHQAKSRYSSRVGVDKSQRSLSIQTPAGENNYKIDSYGELSKSWAPTVVLIKGDQYLILFERDESSEKESITASNIRSISYKAAETGELTWFSTTPLDEKTLTFSEVLDLKAAGRPVPIQYGVRVVARLAKKGESLLQLEVSGKESSNPDAVLLHHNEVRFQNFAQLTGPLKKETVSLKTPDVKDGGENGTWTLTVEGE